MLLELTERYNYKNCPHKDLRTFLFEFDSLNYKVIDLMTEICKLDLDKNFMDMWNNEGKQLHKKIKYCLCKNRPDIECLLNNEDFYLNDYDMVFGTNIVIMKAVVASIVKDNKVTHILIDKRRYDSILLNDNGEVIRRYAFG